MNYKTSNLINYCILPLLLINFFIKIDYQEIIQYFIAPNLSSILILKTLEYDNKYGLIDISILSTLIIKLNPLNYNIFLYVYYFIYFMILHQFFNKNINQHKFSEHIQYIFLFSFLYYLSTNDLTSTFEYAIFSTTLSYYYT